MVDCSMKSLYGYVSTPPPPAHIESYKYEQYMIVYKMIRYNILHNIMLNNNLTQKHSFSKLYYVKDIQHYKLNQTNYTIILLDQNLLNSNTSKLDHNVS